MSSLRSQLNKKLSYKTKDVEYEGNTYRFGGYPSSSLMLDVSAPDAGSQNLSTLWNLQFCPKDDAGNNVDPMPKTFKPENVGQIKTVLYYALPDEGEAPYTITEIAEIFATNPGLFAYLYGAATTIMTAANVVEVAAGNSPAEVPVT